MSAYQFLPPLAPDERAALRESITTFGILQPVVVDEEGNVLDGHHRAEIATELGIDYPRIVLPGLSEEQKIEQALVLNLARRHLAADQKQALVADLRSRGLSIRWISERTGIPKSTVSRLSSGVPDGTPRYVSGRDGKQYRAQAPDLGDPERFRRELIRCGLEDWEIVFLTVEELHAGLVKWGIDAAADDPRLAHTLYECLAQQGARGLLRTGQYPAMPRHVRTAWFPIPTSAQARRRLVSRFEAESDDAAVWQIYTEMYVGSFLNWCDAAGIDLWKKQLPETVDTYVAGVLAVWLGPERALGTIGDRPIGNVLTDAERARIQAAFYPPEKHDEPRSARIFANESSARIAADHLSSVAASAVGAA